ncbi:MAG: hypothetical protein K9J85_04985 [Desulfobacteraceae bacterium]|nr:hypothetical protein [Desulfobacteraceae bacterium]
MSKFDEFAEALKEGAAQLAKEVFEGFEKQAKDDAAAFLEKTAHDIKRWTRLLAKGKLTEQDFSDLVHAKKALAEIHALRQAGLGLTKLERFRNRFVDMVIDKAFEVFL